MVNYCCVPGCGRNNKTSKHLFYYGLPKELPRLEQWVQAIGKEHLLDKKLKKLSYRVCSRHFSPADIKNKHLCANAVPTLYLPSSESQEDEEKPSVHEEVVCNSCEKPIVGFRYKCITCPDYDLCSKCEMFEAHSNHYLLRIPRPINYRVADNLIKKWQQFVDKEKLIVHTNPEESSDDDVPIKMYIKQFDSAVDLPEDIKTKIRNEVSRVLSIKEEPNKTKRKKETKKKEGNKKKKIEVVKNNDTQEFENEESLVPEVVFADVNDVKSVQLIDIKDEISIDMTPTLKETNQTMTDLNLTDADFILTSLT